MILEELLDCSADKLMAMTDKELEEFFMPWFHITRPEQAARKSSASAVVVSPEQQLKLKAMADLGIDISAIKKKLSKK